MSATLVCNNQLGRSAACHFCHSICLQSLHVPEPWVRFAFELLARLFIYGRSFFCSRDWMWNWLDVLIVASSLVPSLCNLRMRAKDGKSGSLNNLHESAIVCYSILNMCLIVFLSFQKVTVIGLCLWDGWLSHHATLKQTSLIQVEIVMDVYQATASSENFEGRNPMSGIMASVVFFCVFLCVLPICG